MPRSIATNALKYSASVPSSSLAPGSIVRVRSASPDDTFFMPFDTPLILDVTLDSMNMDMRSTKSSATPRIAAMSTIPRVSWDDRCSNQLSVLAMTMSMTLCIVPRIGAVSS
jgi:hypothetical protein